jgi:hypothetical protein
MSQKRGVAPGHNKRYGTVHRKRRARVARAVNAGTAHCVRCGELIPPESEWHLDHADEGQGWLGPAHAQCNTSHGGRLGRQRQLGTVVSISSDGDLVMPGWIGPERWSRCWLGCGPVRHPLCPVPVDECDAANRGRDSGDPLVA